MTASVETFGDFTIVKELGSGAFGSVFLAEHRYMKKQCAIKIIPGRLSSDPEFIEKFETNISAISKLDHPSIIKIHNVSSYNGKYFLVMDPIVDSNQDTVNLEKYLKESGIISEKEVESILSQIASALDYAHKFPFGKSYLFHGSLKLSNILIQKSNRSIRAYLSDFGLNRLVGEKAVFTEIAKNMAEALNTYEGESFIKESALSSYFTNFAFLAPEQKVVGNRDYCDAKVDTYSLGVLSYYLLTGRQGDLCANKVIKDLLFDIECPAFL